jgi:UDP-N-acetylglucosamine 2-epimerase (non-hydrolysing)
LPVIFPAHQRTADALERHGLTDSADELIHVIEPVGCVDFIRLMDAAERIVTDSGGVKKDAFFLDLPCIKLREETERIEISELGLTRIFKLDGEKL